MKFLLTSAGLKNHTIVSALNNLTNKEPSRTKVIFIPTAANVEAGDKDWLIDDLYAFREFGYASTDIIDIAAVPKEVWLPRLEDADVICVGGGNEQFLVRIMRSSGFADVLPDLLERRVYMGISAGAMVIGKLLQPEEFNIIYPDQKGGEKGLQHVNLYMLPHLNSPYFPTKRKEIIEKLRTRISDPLYALDDQSALKIVNHSVEIISEGEIYTIL
jgi:dipeptidase E